MRGLVLLLMGLPFAAAAVEQVLPPSTDANYCGAVQRVLAVTSMSSDNTVFTDMPSYRHSKPKIRPLTTYQVVSYLGQIPVMVSCKIKSASHIRAEYGEQAVGQQQFCPAITRLNRQAAVIALRAAGEQEAAEQALAIVVDDTEPGLTGRHYLADFELSYVSEDGKLHVASPGLYHDYDSWMTWILPEILEGQMYCHIPTAEYIQALATGAVEPGTLMTTVDDAPVTPQ
jgi:hypothetical protein